MNACIRRMTRNDVERVGEILFDAFNVLASKHGLAPRLPSAQAGLAWAWTMHRHGPTDLLVAEVDQRVVGFSCLNPRGDIGGFGPFAVDPYLKSRGVGSKLLSEALRSAERLHSVRCYQEAYNPISFAVLYSYNFRPVAHLLNLIRSAGPAGKEDLSGNVYKLEKGNISEIVKYDLQRSKVDRRTDLEYYVRWGKVFFYQYQSRIRGFLACLPGSASVLLGPMLAEGEEEAECLYRHALAVFKERTCRTILMARDDLLVGGLMKLGFQIYCLSNLMVCGDWRPGRYVESITIFPEGI